MPAVLYLCVGLVDVEVIPFPNLQRYDNEPAKMEDLLVNEKELVLRHCVSLFMVNAGNGFGYTVTLILVESVQLLSLVTRRVMVYVPGFAYVYVGLMSDEVAPSPNFHW